MRKRRVILAGILVIFWLAPAPLAQPAPDLRKDQAVLAIDGMDRVTVRTGIVFKEVEGARLAFDLYLPPDRKGAEPLPLVIFANGVGDWDPALKEWGIYKSWGRLVAASGLAAITHDSRRDRTAEDLRDLVSHVRGRGRDLGVDPDNIALWSCSANVRAAFPLAMDPKSTFFKAAVVYYGTVDPNLIRTDLPLLIARAGIDNANTNNSINAYASRALAANAPLTLINLRAARHGFDLVDDNDASREVIKATLAFLRENLSPGVQRGRLDLESQARAMDLLAAKDWERAAAAYQDWVRKEPNSGMAQQGLGESLYNLKRYREAAEAYQRAGDLGVIPALTWYNAACCRALLGEKDQAMDLLTKAFGTGRITNRKSVREDPDLAALRDDPRFRSLTADPAN